MRSSGLGAQLIFDALSEATRKRRAAREEISQNSYTNN